MDDHPHQPIDYARPGTVPQRHVLAWIALALVLSAYPVAALAGRLLHRSDRWSRTAVGHYGGFVPLPALSLAGIVVGVLAIRRDSGPILVALMARARGCSSGPARCSSTTACRGSSEPRGTLGHLTPPLREVRRALR